MVIDKFHKCVTRLYTLFSAMKADVYALKYTILNALANCSNWIQVEHSRVSAYSSLSLAILMKKSDVAISQFAVGLKVI